MPLTTTPDLRSTRRALTVAALTTFGVWAMLALTLGDINRTLGDTDDAMRLVRVRDLLAGQGWFDQHVMRLQPPFGTMMHWSRLLDGALAAMDWTIARAVPSAAAEWATRFFWPLLWIGPAVFCVLTIMRRLGGSSAVLIGAVLLLIDGQLYAQFRPGRIDHHNIQIVMALIAAACAISSEGRARWAALSAFASALGLAIGIEALAFHALVGTSYALRMVADPAERRAARAYGLTLAVSSLALFVLQTPPGLWLVPACDALGANLVLALITAGLGLAAVASWTARAPALVRLAMLAVVGAAAAGAYLISDPVCLHGPLAAVDPRLRPIWLDRIQELRTFPALWQLDRKAAIVTGTMIAIGLASAAALAIREWRKPSASVLLTAALVGLSALATIEAYRMNDYAFWFGIPALAAVLALVVDRLLGSALIGALALALVAAPETLTLLTTQVASAATRGHDRTGSSVASESCSDTQAYTPLAALPSGLVLAPIDLGPFVLAHTHDSVLSAPYHRMAWAILAAHEALDAPDALAHDRVRALHVTYIVDCPTDHSDPRPGGLTYDLRHGHAPTWLHSLSDPRQVLRIYSVAPVNAPKGG